MNPKSSKNKRPRIKRLDRWPKLSMSIFAVVVLVFALSQIDWNSWLPNQDRKDWDIAKKADTIPAYNAYLGKHPKGQYVEKARKEIKKLELFASFPVDVRKVAQKIGIDKISKNDKGYWEVDYGDGIVMVYIPAGKFTMGSNEGSDDEKPVHTVFLDGYWIGKYEVTVGQYKKFLTESKDRSLPDYVSKYSPEDNYPLVGVSWHDVKAYCKWLSQKKGVIFKSPSEAQWEKAARGTDGRIYPWGNQIPDKNLANFDGNVGKARPVGSYPAGASPYGLLDMAGNVWEWCSDWYDYYYYQNSPGKNPKGPDSGSFRVFRGGNWSFDSRVVRCAYRYYFAPTYRFHFVGARLCQELSTK